LLIDQPVVLCRRLPTHAADDTNRFQALRELEWVDFDDFTALATSK
jgi:hypothetical protein